MECSWTSHIPSYSTAYPRIARLPTPSSLTLDSTHQPHNVSATYFLSLWPTHKVQLCSQAISPVLLPISPLFTMPTKLAMHQLGPISTSTSRQQWLRWPSTIWTIILLEALSGRIFSSTTGLWCPASSRISIRKATVLSAFTVPIS